MATDQTEHYTLGLSVNLISVIHLLPINSLPLFGLCLLLDDDVHAFLIDIMAPWPLKSAGGSCQKIICSHLYVRPVSRSSESSTRRVRAAGSPFDHVLSLI